MMLLAAGFVVFCVGGSLFQKGGIDRAHGQVATASLRAHASSAAGITLMAIGGVLMMVAGI